MHVHGGPYSIASDLLTRENFAVPSCTHRMTYSSGDKRTRGLLPTRPRSTTLRDRLQLQVLTETERRLLHHGHLNDMLLLDDNHYQCASRKLCIMGFITDAAAVGQKSVSYFCDAFLAKIRVNNQYLCDGMLFIPPWHEVLLFLMSEFQHAKAHPLPMPHPSAYYPSIARSWLRRFRFSFKQWKTFHVIEHEFVDSELPIGE
jgi:hypothetical protein